MDENERGRTINAAKDIVALKASHLLAGITNESFMMPIIAQPIFDDQLPTPGESN